MSTIFTKIIKGEIPCNKILENENFLAFHDIHPQAKIHALIIPKTEYKNFQEVDSEIMKDMSDFIKEVARTLKIDKSGYRLTTNCGEDARQEVQHLHFHMLGGEKL